MRERDQDIFLEIRKSAEKKFSLEMGQQQI